MRLVILQKYHTLPASGHWGSTKTTDLVKRRYYWPSMHQDIKHFIASCETCQRHRVSNKPQPGLLRPLPIPSGRFENICIDFFELFPSSKKVDQVMIVVGRLTKLTALIPCLKTSTAEQVGELIIQYWYCRGFGFAENDYIRSRWEIYIASLAPHVPGTRY